MHHKLIVFFVVFFISFSNLLAQTDSSSNRFRASIGAGIGVSIHPFNGYTDLKLFYNDYGLSGRILGGTEFSFGSSDTRHTESFHEQALLIQKRITSTNPIISVGAGISRINIITNGKLISSTSQNGFSSHERLDYDIVGVPLEACLDINSDYAGLSLKAFANINSELSIFGAFLGVNLGKLN